MMMLRILGSLMVAIICLPANHSQAAAPTVVGFGGGSDSGFTGNAFYEAAGGNPNGNAHFFLDAQGLSLRTGAPGETTNPNFLGDYSQFTDISWGADVKVDFITDFIGNQIPRELGIIVKDRDLIGPSGPAGLYFPLGLISAFDTPDFTTLSVSVSDPTQDELPIGVIGLGDEDPITFEPILPAGATFASVLAGVDEFELTTFVPGYFFTFANYDVRLDNVFLEGELIPEPSSGLLMLAGLLALRFRRLLGNPASGLYLR